MVKESSTSSQRENRDIQAAHRLQSLRIHHALTFSKEETRRKIMIYIPSIQF